jgi:hypothetical protein
VNDRIRFLVDGRARATNHKNKFEKDDRQGKKKLGIHFRGFQDSMTEQLETKEEFSRRNIDVKLALDYLRDWPGVRKCRLSS